MTDNIAASDVSKLTDDELRRLLAGAPVAAKAAPAPADVKALTDDQLRALLSGAPTIAAEPSKSGGIVPPLFYGTQGAYHGIADVLGQPANLAAKALEYASSPLGAVGSAIGMKPLYTAPAEVLGGPQSIERGMNWAMSKLKGATGVGTPELPMTYTDINQVPEQYRPSARLGEATGSAIPLVAAPMLAAAGRSIPAIQAAAKIPTANIGANLWRQSVAEAATNPQFVASQLPGNIGAGVGSYLAETAFPGSPLAQVVGQLGGGLTGAAGTGAVKAGTSSMGDRLRSLTAPFATQTEGGIQTAAARALNPILQQSGEAPEALIARLQAAPSGTGATAGDLARSRGISGLQTYLAESNPELANAVAAGRTKAAETTQAGLTAGFEPGQQAALTQAAAARQALFSKNLDELVSKAEAKATTAIGPVQPNTPIAREQINLTARNILENSLRTARTQESSLWNQIDAKQPVGVNNTLSAYADARASMLPEETLPPLVENVMKRLQGSTVGPTMDEAQSIAAGVPMGASTPAPISFGDVKQLRTNLLEQARTARSKGDWNDARIYTKVSDGLLEDMAAVNDPAVLPAREYSVALNDRFSRSFAGDVLGLKPSGAPAVRPALTLEAAAAGMPQKAAQQMAELPAAAGFASPEMGAEMGGVQQQFMRSLSEKVINPATGRVKPDQVDAFVRDNGAILEQFPQYRASLEAARDTERAFQGIVKQTDAAGKFADKQTAFGQVLKTGENPADAVASALRGAYPARDLKKIASLARSGGDDSVAGLRGAVLQHVMDSAQVGGKFSYGKASTLLNTPVSADGPTLLKSLRDNGIVTATQQAQIQQYMDRGLLDETSRVSGIQVSNFGTEPGKLAKAAARIFGARLASKFDVGGSGAGSSLQAASIGASLAENAFARLPADKAKALMSAALASEDPADLISILEKASAGGFVGGATRLPEPTRNAIVLLRAAIPRDKSQVKFEGQ